MASLYWISLVFSIEYQMYLLLFHKNSQILIQISYCQVKQLALLSIKHLLTIVILALIVVIKTNKDYFQYNVLFEMCSIYYEVFWNIYMIIFN